MPRHLHSKWPCTGYTVDDKPEHRLKEQRVHDLIENRDAPTVVCLDDFALQKGYRYAISIEDFQKGDVYQVTKGHSREAIQKALRRWPYAIPSIVITDLAPEMAESVQSVWEETKVAADPFHVIQLFTRQLDHYRKKVTKKRSSPSEKRHITRCLTTHPTNLSFKDLFRLEDWLAKYNELDVLYQALQGLRRIYGSESKDNVMTKFDKWIDHYLFASYKPLHRIAKTI